MHGELYDGTCECLAATPNGVAPKCEYCGGTLEQEDYPEDLREQAALFCQAMASNRDNLIVFDAHDYTLDRAEQLARKAFVVAPIVWWRDDAGVAKVDMVAVWAEAEAMIRCGWEP